MAAAHLATIPCEPNTACKEQGKPHFLTYLSTCIEIVYAGFEGFRTFLYVFMSVFVPCMGKCNYRHHFSSSELLLLVEVH